VALPPLPADMFDEVCPSSVVPFRFGGDKWAALVMRCLEDGPRRFSELRVPLRRVTPKVLTQSLRRLERDGLVERTVHPSSPLPFRRPRNGVTWPPGSAWLSSPCSRYGLGGVATGLGALPDR
jgi:hypothetical protein